MVSSRIVNVAVQKTTLQPGMGKIKLFKLKPHRVRITQNSLMTFAYFCPILMPPFSASDLTVFGRHSGYTPSPSPSALLILSSSVTNSLFSCFAESSSWSSWGETLDAFVFSLSNSGSLPPFKMLCEKYI